MARTGKPDRAVKFSVSVNERQIRFLDFVAASRGWGRSRTVQEVLDFLIRNPSIFSPADLHISADRAHNGAEVKAS